MPERPKFIKDEISYFTSEPLPHFFVYAKDKSEKQVSKINQSFVNKLNNIIPNPRISCKYILNNKTKKLNKPDYTLMMDNTEIKFEIVKGKNGKLIDGTNPVILKYIEKAKEYWQKINATYVYDYPRDVVTKTQIRKEIMYNNIIIDTKHELSQFGHSDNEVADILVKYLYGIKESKYKDLLWTCYGDIIYSNLEKNVRPQTKVVQCVDCGEWFEVGKYDSATRRCRECYNEYRKNYFKEKKRVQREKFKMSTDPIV